MLYLALLLACTPKPPDTSADTAPESSVVDTVSETAGETATPDTADTTVPDTSSPDTDDTAETARTVETADTGDTAPPPVPLDPCFDDKLYPFAWACDDLEPTYDGAFWDGIDPADPSFEADLQYRLGAPDYVSYDELWTAFPFTDAREDGTVWDIYADTAFDFDDDRCGSYSSEGDCFNREHTWPQSWSSDDSSLKRDLVIVLPTDGWVNGKRGDLTLGEVDEVEDLSSNRSKWGECTFGDDEIEVFEPADEYMGDLARIYFYVTLRFRGEDSDWLSNEAVTRATLNPEAEGMLRRWNFEDPVSDKEIARNDAVEALQGNRNPFVDHPEWVCEIADF